MSAVEEVNQGTHREQKEGKPTQQMRAVLRQQKEGADGQEAIERPGGGPSAAYAITGISLRVVRHELPCLRRRSIDPSGTTREAPFSTGASMTPGKWWGDYVWVTYS